ncbi:MAG TPA: 3-isopropylmalate dehydrogenase [Dehalococcoidia bacterium]|nr:3-isopropylmalate dehydrogenase [Dehalococcoidia bacterium]
MNFTIALLRGDGIGPEIADEALRVLAAVGRRFGHEFQYVEAYAGGEAWDRYGEHLPAVTLEACRGADAILKGPFGGPPEEVHHAKWSGVEQNAILGLRRAFDLFMNLRPVTVYPEVVSLSPLRPEIVEGADMLIVRELTSGIYFGERGERRVDGQRQVWDTEAYTEGEIARIAHGAFRMARLRRKHVTLVAKSNVLNSSVLWRDVFAVVAKEYGDVTTDYLHVDNASMQIITNPRQFDVLLTNNIFGDILSDEASVLAGSLGMLGSASLNADGFGMYEPIHGSAPDIAGQGKANPVAMVLSAAMMLRLSFRLEAEAAAVEAAVRAALAAGLRTPDIAGAGGDVVSTQRMGEAIERALAG